MPMATSRASRSGTWPGSPRRCCRSLRKIPMPLWRPPEALEVISCPASSGLSQPASGASSACFKPNPANCSLAKDLLDRMAANSADFTLTFRRYATPLATPTGTRMSAPSSTIPALSTSGLNGGAIASAAEGGEPAERVAVMRAGKPRIHPAQSSGRGGDHGGTGSRAISRHSRLCSRVLAAPYDDQPGFARYAEPPRPDQVVHQTFCGTWISQRGLGNITKGRRSAVKCHRAF